MSGELIVAIFQELALINPGISVDELAFFPVPSHPSATASLVSLTG